MPRKAKGRVELRNPPESPSDTANADKHQRKAGRAPNHKEGSPTADTFAAFSAREPEQGLEEEIRQAEMRLKLLELRKREKELQAQLSPRPSASGSFPGPAPATDDRLRRLLRSGFAVKTRQLYLSHLRNWLRFCARARATPAKPSARLLASFLSDLSARVSSYSTVTSHLSALSWYFGLSGCPDIRNSPWVRLILRGIRRELAGRTRARRKQPLSLPALRKLRAAFDLSVGRDAACWAAILIGFWGMLRKSNLFPASQQLDPRTDLLTSDLELHSQGLLIRVRYSKTIQFAQRVHQLCFPSAREFHPLCPYFAMRHHVAVNQLLPCNTEHLFSFRAAGSERREFLSARQFDTLLARRLQAAGLDSSKLSGHSLRRGGATAALELGASKDAVMARGDWRSNAVERYLAGATAPSSWQTASLLADGLRSTTTA